MTRQRSPRRSATASPVRREAPIPSSQSAATTTLDVVPLQQRSRLLRGRAEHHHDARAPALRRVVTASTSQVSTSALGRPIRRPGTRGEQQSDGSPRPIVPLGSADRRLPVDAVPGHPRGALLGHQRAGRPASARAPGAACRPVRDLRAAAAGAGGDDLLHPRRAAPVRTPPARPSTSEPSPAAPGQHDRVLERHRGALSRARRRRMGGVTDHDHPSRDHVGTSAGRRCCRRPARARPRRPGPPPGRRRRGPARAASAAIAPAGGPALVAR